MKTHFVSILLLVCIFNTPLLVSAEILAETESELIKSAKADAEADAELDVMQSAFSGCVGTCAFSFIMTMAVYERSVSTGAVCVSVPTLYTLGIHIYARRSTPTPPADRLLGKPIVYVDTYTSTYLHKVRKHRTDAVNFGSIVGIFAGFACYQILTEVLFKDLFGGARVF